MTPLEAIAGRGVDVPLPRAPAERPCGVYLLVSSGRVVYIGATANLEARLANHLNGVRRSGVGNALDQPAKVFDRVIWLQLARADLSAYEGALIRALRPPLNGRAPAPCGRDLEVLDRLGLPPHNEELADAEFRRARYTPRPKPVRPSKHRAPVSRLGESRKAPHVRRRHITPEQR